MILLGLAVLGFGGMSLWLRNFLRSAAFREMVSSKAGEVLQVEGAFSPFRWDGFAVDVDQYRGEGAALIRKIEVDGLHTEVGLTSFWDGAWQVKNPRVRRLKLELVPAGDAQVSGDTVLEPVPSAAQPVEKSGWLPTRVEMESLRLDELDLSVALDSGPLRLTGAMVEADPDLALKQVDLKVLGGELEAPYAELGKVRLEQVDLRCSEDRLFLNQANARFWENGTVDATGEFDLPGKTFMVQGKVAGVSCEEVLKGDWVKRVSGKLSSDYHVISNKGDLSLSGHLVVQDGVLTALPVLDTLAAYTNTRRFRVLQLREAQTDWHWKPDELLLNKVVLESEGLVRVEGNLAIRGDKLDGRFRIGVMPGTLSTIPGAETHVFQPGERNMLWAPIRITGTVDKPEEDLSQRLMLAAGARLFTIIPETGAKVLKFSGREIKDGADKVIEEGKNLIEGAGSLLDGLLGPR